jgi:hypothetical protein
MKRMFWLQLGLVVLLAAYLLVRRRRSRKKRMIESLYRRGATDSASLHPFDLAAVHKATVRHDLNHLQAKEAYRRGYFNEEPTLALRDLAAIKAQLGREANGVRQHPAKHPA